MVLAEQFVFTSADLEKNSGYQVISKSSGITSDLVSELESYLYPVGVDPIEFTSSRSMIVLKNQIAFIQSKNIGVGFDGRPDTMYSHIIVLDKENFVKLKNDSRMLNEYYTEIKKPVHLTPLIIEPQNMFPDFSCVDLIGIINFEKCMNAVFEHKKIALVNIDNQKLIQSILSLVPPSLRLISFSTVVPQPERQTQFKIIQVKKLKSKLLSKYLIVDVAEQKQAIFKEDTLFDVCRNYLIEIIDKKKSNELTEIYDEFENIPIPNTEEKLSLIIGILLLNSRKIFFNKQKVLEDVFKTIEKLPYLYSVKYWQKIKEFLTPEELEKYALEFEIQHIINESKNKKITLETLVSMFYLLKHNNPKTRQALLEELFNKSPERLLKDGVQLLIDANYAAIYRDEIIQLFIEKEKLNAVILKIFDEKQELSQVKKQFIYEEFVKKSSTYNVNFALELLTRPIFDFNDEYESKHFKNLLKEIFGNIFSNNRIVDSNRILNMVGIIFDKIKNVLEVKSKFNTERKSIENLEQLIKITEVLQNYLDRILDKNQDSPDMQKKIKIVQQELSEFIMKHPIPDKKPKYWWYSD